jgi:hypothetical protein
VAAKPVVTVVKNRRREDKPIKTSPKFRCQAIIPIETAMLKVVPADLYVKKIYSKAH